MVQRNAYNRLIALLIKSLILHSIIISFRPAWLARALLSFKRAQSSGNDNRVKDKRHPLCAKDYMCQSSSPKLPMAVDTAVGWQLPVVLTMSSVCPADANQAN